MQSSQHFDYNRPTRDTLAGIYVEACDEPVEEVAPVDATIRPERVGESKRRLEELFGLTMTVDDGMATGKGKGENDKASEVFVGN